MPELSEHACFRCRKVFKKPHWYAFKGKSSAPPVYPCPECGDDMIAMGYKFRAPAKRDIKEWKRIKDAIDNGVEWQVPTVRKEERDT